MRRIGICFVAIFALLLIMAESQNHEDKLAAKERAAQWGQHAK